MSELIFEFCDICKSYGNKKVFDGFSLIVG